jgi:hypothetical protein
MGSSVRQVKASPGVTFDKKHRSYLLHDAAGNAHAAG